MVQFSFKWIGLVEFMNFFSFLYLDWFRFFKTERTKLTELYMVQFHALV